MLVSAHRLINLRSARVYWDTVLRKSPRKEEILQHTEYKDPSNCKQNNSVHTVHTNFSHKLQEHFRDTVYSISLVASKAQMTYIQGIVLESYTLGRVFGRICKPKLHYQQNKCPDKL